MTDPSIIDPTVLYASAVEENVLVVFSIFSICVGGVGNSLVLLLFYLDRMELHIAHYFITSMAVSDFLEVSTGVPMLAYTRLYLKKDDPLCPVVYGVKAFAYLPSLFSVLLTAIDRYWSIVHAVHYRANATRRMAKIALVIIWSSSIVLGLCVAFIRNPGPIEKNQPCFMQKLVHSAVLRLIFWFIIPICLMVVAVLYTRIYHRLTKMVEFKTSRGSTLMALLTILRTTSNTGGMSRAKIQKIKEVKTTILMVFTVVFFVICWLPSVLSLVFLVYTPHLVKPYMRTSVFILYSLNSAFNPFLYAFHISKLRKRFDQIKNWFACRRIMDDSRRYSFDGPMDIPSSTKSSGSGRVCYNEFDLQL